MSADGPATPAPADPANPAAAPHANDAGLILRHARIHTLGRAGTVEALALRGSRILAAGSLTEAWAALGSDARELDLGGRTVLPGLVDAHLHWAGFSLGRRRLALNPDDSMDAVLAQVAAAARGRPAGEWLLGRGWDHSRWSGWPTRQTLDAVAGTRPVALTRKDGHAVWANSLALQAAGIDGRTPDPPGGTIQRAAGEPTGILLERAIELVNRALPAADAAERRAALVDAWPEAWSRGLTGCHEMGFRGFDLWEDLIALRAEGRLGLRFAWYGLEETLAEMIARGMRSGDGDAWLRMGGLKLFLDGTLGSQTAAMLEPYEGQPDNRGKRTLEPEDCRALATRAAEAGLATAMHAIGDAANRLALDTFAAVRAALPRQAVGLRQRVEHAQIVHPLDRPRFAALGVVASMQPIHLLADRPVAEAVWGARTVDAYAWRSLQTAGATLAFGSDAPVESLDPFAGIRATLTRRDAEGMPEGGWHPQECLDIDSALGAYIRGAAWAAGLERELGNLEPGKLADLIVLEGDPRSPGTDPTACRVMATMIDGAWVWQSPALDLAGPRHPELAR